MTTEEVAKRISSTVVKVNRDKIYRIITNFNLYLKIALLRNTTIDVSEYQYNKILIIAENQANGWKNSEQLEVFKERGGVCALGEKIKKQRTSATQDNSKVYELVSKLATRMAEQAVLIQKLTKRVEELEKR